MKESKDLKERLFVMHLQRELDFRQMRGEIPDMEHSVQVARQNAILTVDHINKMQEASDHDRGIMDGTICESL